MINSEIKHQLLLIWILRNYTLKIRGVIAINNEIKFNSPADSQNCSTLSC